MIHRGTIPPEIDEASSGHEDNRNNEEDVTPRQEEEHAGKAQVGVYDSSHWWEKSQQAFCQSIPPSLCSSQPLSGQRCLLVMAVVVVVVVVVVVAVVVVVVVQEDVWGPLTCRADDIPYPHQCLLLADIFHQIR